MHTQTKPRGIFDAHSIKLAAVPSVCKSVILAKRARATMEASEWIEVESKTRPGRYYYFNKTTKKSVWRAPEGFTPHHKDSSSKENQSERAAVPKSSPAKVTNSNVTVNGSQPPKLKVSQSSIQARIGTASRAVVGKMHLQTNSNNCMEAAYPDPSIEEEAMETERWGDDDVIDMDVDMTEEEQLALISEIHTTRNHLPLAERVDSLIEQAQSADAFSQKLYLVLDTNILISHLGFLGELKDYAIKGVGRPVLVVPWVVMQELDALKTRDNQRLADKARDAIRFLNDSFQAQHPRVRGQTMDEVHTELKNIAISNNDDRILHCCLLYQDKVKGHGGMVVLFSNDVQLCSKAMVNQVRALNRKTLLNELRVLFKGGAPAVPIATTAPQGLLSTPSTAKIAPISRAVLEELLCESESVVGSALSAVIHKEMVEAYADLWETIVSIKPPWQFKDTVKIIDKHWVAVFRSLVPNHLHHSSIADLLKHVSQRDRMVPTVTVVGKFQSSAMELLRAFAEVSGYNGVLPQSVVQLAALTEGLAKAQSKSATTPTHQVTSHVTTPDRHVSFPGPSHVTTPIGHVTSPMAHVSTPMGHVTSPRSLPLITSLLRPSCDEILGLCGATPSQPLEQLRWILDVIMAVTKHCHSRIMLTVQNNPHSIRDKQDAGVFLSQLVEILKGTTSSINKLLVNETTRELIREMLLSFQIFLQTTLLRNSPLTLDGFMKSVLESSSKVQQYLIDALGSFSAMIGALQQLPHELGL